MDFNDNHQGGRNAIYLLRTVQQHHVHLSAMADNKAGVLLGASFVSLTIIGAWVGSGQARYAAIVLGVAVLLTAFFAVLALIPRSGAGKWGKAATTSARNVLFFGHFCVLDYEDFEQEMLAILDSDESIYRALIRDIYGIGQVQHRSKYKFIRYSYVCFLVGLVVAPLTALVEYLVSRI